MKQLYYTGVGSRQTPLPIQHLMRNIAHRLQEMGLRLRTGDATGADRAFRNACCNQEVYTAKESVLHSINPYVIDAMAMAERIHPAWDRMSEYAQALHARNCFQVLGECLDNPSEFLICWTPEGKPVGGTRTAIMVAKEHGVPVFNLGDSQGLSALTGHVKMQPWYAAHSLSHS
jgi:hypothetical protein